MAERKYLEADPDSGGDWLYRQGELVLGPLPAQQLVDKLYAGELSGRTEISPVGQRAFRPIAAVDAFKLHVAKAEAKQRVDAAARVERERERRQRNIRVALVALVALIVAGAAAAVARYLAIYNPFKGAGDLAVADITVEAPRITVARARGTDEELLDYPGGSSSSPVAHKPPERSPDKPRGAMAERLPEAERAARLPPAGGKLNSEAEEPDGLQTAKFDRSAINAVISAKKPTLYPCFNEEAQRHPGFSAQIPLEFVIGNDGRVNKLWVDNPSYKQGPLADCLLRELQKWPFKPYPGEQATVQLSFKIGKGG